MSPVYPSVWPEQSHGNANNTQDLIQHQDLKCDNLFIHILFHQEDGGYEMIWNKNLRFKIILLEKA